jgi:hypothetical protein
MTNIVGFNISKIDLIIILEAMFYVKFLLKQLSTRKTTNGKVVKQILGPGLAYNHTQHQCCTTCLLTPLPFQDRISLKLFYE